MRKVSFDGRATRAKNGRVCNKELKSSSSSDGGERRASGTFINAAAAAVAVTAVGLIGHAVVAGQSPPGSRFVVISARREHLSMGAAWAEVTHATRGAVSSESNTLAFRQSNVRLVVRTGPDKDMLSYRIAGLRNPTLVLPRGAILQVFYENTDSDMAHNLRFTTRQPPFPAMMAAGRSEGTADLAPSNSTTLYAEELTMRAPYRSGSYSYVCTMRGHARGGMFGTIEVR